MCDASQIQFAIEQYGDMVRRICFLYLKKPHDVEDVFQEVFMKYLLHPDRFESDDHEKAWIARVAVNRCKDSLRSFFRRKVTSLEDVPEDTKAVLSPDYAELYEAVLSLSSNYKIVVYLFYFEGYSVVEIARILGRKENTIYTWLSRARKELRQMLEGDGFDG